MVGKSIRSNSKKILSKFPENRLQYPKIGLSEDSQREEQYEETIH